VNDNVKSTQRQGMRGPRPLMVSCGGVAMPGRQRSRGKISGLDVVDGSVRSYVRSMAGGPGKGLSGAATMTRCWSPWSAGVRMVGERAVLAGQVVIFDRSGSGAVIGVGGHAAGRAELAQCENKAGPAGVGDADGRAVVMGCDEPLARGGGGRGTRLARSGVVQIGFAGGHFGMRWFAVGGLAGGDVVTRLSQVARNMVGRREIR
jgi:hypothetical protein